MNTIMEFWKKGFAIVCQAEHKKARVIICELNKKSK